MAGRRSVTILGALLTAVVAACGSDRELDRLSGSVSVDGSSTVFPITEAVAEEFTLETRGAVRVTVALSGTGGGFRRFCAGETDISNASRHILPTEVDACAANGVEYVVLPIALDGLAIVVHPSNDFAQCFTIDELRRIWEPGSTIQRWSDVRPEWPDRPIRLYGPGTNSGTFDFFTEEIGGRAGASRSDYTASEDDNVLVQGVAGDINALGYFGFAYYGENRTRVKVAGVDAGSGCIIPDTQTIEQATYSPLSRPLILYVKLESLQRPELSEFVDYYLDVAGELAAEVGYVSLSPERYAASRSELDRVRNAQ